MIEQQQQQQQSRRQIINVTSVNDVVAVPGNSAYCASKYALEGWRDAVLRKELKPFDIDIVLVRPGSFATLPACSPACMHASIRARMVHANFRAASPAIHPTTSLVCTTMVLLERRCMVRNGIIYRVLCDTALHCAAQPPTHPRGCGGRYYCRAFSPGKSRAAARPV